MGSVGPGTREDRPTARTPGTTFAGVPSRHDPRWGQVAALTTFAVLGQVWLDWHVTPVDIVLAVVTCVGLDLALTLRRRRQVIVPLSGLISGLGLAMLLRSSYPAFFVVAGIMAIGSKHLLVTADGSHRFNPSNFGLVVALAFGQGGLTMVTPGQWGRSGLILFAVIGAGSLVVFRAERLTLALLYLASSAVLTPIFHGGHLDLGLSLGGDVLAFAFFMITDPKTAPRTFRGQAVYAPVIAFLGAWSVSLGSMAGIFVAPFVVALAKPVVLAGWRRWRSGDRPAATG